MRFPLVPYLYWIVCNLFLGPMLCSPMSWDVTAIGKAVSPATDPHSVWESWKQSHIVSVIPSIDDLPYAGLFGALLHTPQSPGPHVIKVCGQSRRDYMGTWGHGNRHSQGGIFNLYPKLEQAGRRYHTILEERVLFRKNKLSLQATVHL